MSKANLATATFVWPSMSYLSGKQIVFRATGYKSGDQWTGRKVVDSTQLDFFFWKWLHENRNVLPPFFDESFIPHLQRYFDDQLLATHERNSVHSPGIDGIYFSDQFKSPSIETLFLEVLERFSKRIHCAPLRYLEGELREILEIFCNGKGELFVFLAGRCNYFAILGKEDEYLNRHLEIIERRINRAIS
jgi:hypothetical protein